MEFILDFMSFSKGVRKELKLRYILKNLMEVNVYVPFINEKYQEIIIYMDLSSFIIKDLKFLIIF